MFRTLSVALVLIVTSACTNPVSPTNNQTPCALGYMRVDTATVSYCVPR